jgi:Lrp/AsnC family transcriptional regulator, leucine-responsive regulatory protein
MDVDDVDLKILALLQEDGRMAHTAIGKLVELSAPSVNARIQRLERQGFIRRYVALLSPEKIGQGLLAFIRVRTQASDDGNRSFERFLQEAPQILECHDVDGEDCYVLKVRTDTPQSLRELIARVRSYPQVTRTITSIVLMTIKEDGLTAPLRFGNSLRLVSAEEGRDDAE